MTGNGTASLEIYDANIYAENGIVDFGGGITVQEAVVKNPVNAVVTTSIFESDGVTKAKGVSIEESKNTI